MATVVLRVIRAPSADADGSPQSSAGPLFRGNGDTDYTCGNCGFAIASGMGATQHVTVESAVCSACGAENAFPPEARN